MKERQKATSPLRRWDYDNRRRGSDKKIGSAAEGLGATKKQPTNQPSTSVIITQLESRSVGCPLDSVVYNGSKKQRGFCLMGVDEILRRVVDNNNTTADVVRAEIGKALLDGKRSPAFREAFGDREPTVDEYVEKLTDVIMRKKN